jgi:methyltransferase
MVSETLYLALVAAVAVQRLLELRLSRRNLRWALARGGVELGRGHYGPMVALHALFLAGCAVEVLAARRTFLPALAAPMLLLLAGAQGVRAWTQQALGPRWNTRVIVVPGLPRVRSGPYRFLRHPGYLAVVVEGFALPLVHGAWVTAVGFSLANAWLLRTRIRCEEQALARYTGVASGGEPLASGVA